MADEMRSSLGVLSRIQVEHVFIGNNEGQCLYGGFVGWLHTDGLRRTLEDIKKQYRDLCSATVH